jgi:predicted nucleic acid-binding Zn ribbon protein
MTEPEADRSDSQALPNSLPFEDRRQALSYPDAERRDAARGAGASHLVDQRRGQAGAAATKRVTDRNRAAVDAQFCVVDAQLALTGEGLRGERLVASPRLYVSASLLL